MSETITLPELGESVTEGTVTRWLKEVGDTIEVDEPIVEISTDKVDTEIPSPVAGTVLEILVQEDEDIEVGQALAVIGDEGESASDAPADDAAAEDAPAEDETSQEDEPAAEEAPAQEESASASGGSGDAQEVKLPELGESVTEGTITRWLKEVGDDVEIDEPIVEISTDKVDTEIPSPVAGTVLEIKVQEDEDVEVGQVLALVGSADGAAETSAPAADDAPAQEEPSVEEAPEEEAATEEPAEVSSAPEPTPEPTPAPAPVAEKATASPEDTPRGDGYVTPLVRRLAREQGVDLAEVTGTGVGGRIRKQDVLAAAAAKEYEARQEAPAATATPAAAPAAAPAASRPAPKDPASSIDPSKRGTTEKATRIRQVIADRMVESLETSAQLTQVHEIDMTRIVNLRNQVKARFKAENGVNLTFLAFITQAATEALRAHPALNAQYNAETKEITYHDREDIGIAVDTERGLLVPVIKGAGNLNLSGIANAISDLALRTRDNQVKPDELSGGTFSITNLGSFGALFDTPVINQPQVAILGPGNIVKRPVVITDAEGNDVIAIRHMMYLSLTYDHRIVDGADAGRFMTQLKNRLEAGEFGGQLGL